MLVRPLGGVSETAFCAGAAAADVANAAHNPNVNERMTPPPGQCSRRGSVARYWALGQSTEPGENPGDGAGRNWAVASACAVGPKSNVAHPPRRGRPCAE